MLARHSGCCRAQRGRFFRSGITAVPFYRGPARSPAHVTAGPARRGRRRGFLFGFPPRFVLILESFDQRPELGIECARDRVADFFVGQCTIPSRISHHAPHKTSLRKSAPMLGVFPYQPMRCDLLKVPRGVWAKLAGDHFQIIGVGEVGLPCLVSES